MRVKRAWITTAIAVGLWMMTAAAFAQTTDYRFHWAPSPDDDGSGTPLSPAVGYEVWLREDADAEKLVATVMSDTVYTLAAEPGVVHRIRVAGFDGAGRVSLKSDWSDPVYFEDDVRSTPGLPGSAALGGNYPNPFNPETRIRYGVPEEATASDRMRLEIFALDGRRVRTFDVDRTPGWHEVVWDGLGDDGRVQSTGMYVTRFVVGEDVSTTKMTMVK
ncbi:MAG: hypothetical protein GY838_20025 [bacterium]|nr:hypothetical protein [bacterium]